MKKLLALALLALAGCGTCHDGYSNHTFLGIVNSAEYSPCKMGCLKADHPKTCGCSKSCPCWDKHEAPKNGGQ